MNKERLTNLKQILQRNKEFTTLDVIEQLEQQIEKMKCCGNCNFQDMYGDCVLEAPIWCNKIYEDGSDEWELVE